MIDLTETITNAQIAAALVIIAFVLVFHVFRRDVNEMIKKNKKSKQSN